MSDLSAELRAIRENRIRVAGYCARVRGNPYLPDGAGNSSE